MTEKYKLFVICETLEIAKEVLDATGVRELNIGNTPYREKTKQYGKSANLTAGEEELIKGLVDNGIDAYIQMVPTEKSIKCKSLLK